jgi:hypothetical protein
MREAIRLARAEHRGIEIWLDRMAAALASGTIDAARAAFFEARRAALAHYEHEEHTLIGPMRPHLPQFAAKMTGQHDEARELAGHLDDPSVPEAEWLQLARRFLAICQHNIIEEERDWFPLAARVSGYPGEA